MCVYLHLYLYVYIFVCIYGYITHVIANNLIGFIGPGWV